MPLCSLKLRAFRNYESLDLKLGPEITIFTGPNGIGKTTVLEAVSLLGSGRSFRNARNQDFIHKRDELAVVKGEWEDRGLFSEIEVRIYPQSKKSFLDNKWTKSHRTLTELLPTIVFSPADHKIIEGDSTDRKLFLNRAATHIDWEYAEDLQAYSKALLQRNRVLKDASKAGDWNSSYLLDLLAPWDEQLLHFGSRLTARRNIYLSELRPLAAEEYARVAGKKEDQFDLIYQPLGEEEDFIPCDTADEFRINFERRLKDSLRRDFFAGSTQVGPHKDEILLTLNANKVKFYGSQGEKRTCALALRLGELSLFRQKIGKMPVLLFDDVSSELDEKRRKSLVELLKNENTQVLITATELPTNLLGDVGKEFEQLDLQTVGNRT